MLIVQLLLIIETTPLPQAPETALEVVYEGSGCECLFTTGSNAGAEVDIMVYR